MFFQESSLDMPSYGQRHGRASLFLSIVEPPRGHPSSWWKKTHVTAQELPGVGLLLFIIQPESFTKRKEINQKRHRVMLWGKNVCSYAVLHFTLTPRCSLDNPSKLLAVNERASYPPVAMEKSIRERGHLASCVGLRCRLLLGCSSVVLSIINGRIHRT